MRKLRLNISLYIFSWKIILLLHPQCAAESPNETSLITPWVQLYAFQRRRCGVFGYRIPRKDVLQVLSYNWIERRTSTCKLSGYRNTDLNCLYHLAARWGWAGRETVSCSGPSSARGVDREACADAYRSRQCWQLTPRRGGGPRGCTPGCSGWPQQVVLVCGGNALQRVVIVFGNAPLQVVEVVNKTCAVKVHK